MLMKEHRPILVNKVHPIEEAIGLFQLIRIHPIEEAIGLFQLIREHPIEEAIITCTS